MTNENNQCSKSKPLNSQVYLGVKTCDGFLCFVAIVRVRVYYVDFSVFFVLCHRGALHVLTPRMSRFPSRRLLMCVACRDPYWFFFSKSPAKFTCTFAYHEKHFGMDAIWRFTFLLFSRYSCYQLPSTLCP